MHEIQIYVVTLVKNVHFIFKVKWPRKKRQFFPASIVEMALIVAEACLGLSKNYTMYNFNSNWLRLIVFLLFSCASVGITLCTSFIFPTAILEWYKFVFYLYEMVLAQAEDSPNNDNNIIIIIIIWCSR